MAMSCNENVVIGSMPRQRARSAQALSGVNLLHLFIKIALLSIRLSSLIVSLMPSDGGLTEKSAPSSAPRRFSRKGNGRDSDPKGSARGSSDESSVDVALSHKPVQGAPPMVSFFTLFRCALCTVC